ncbi:MAG: hypothetical protein KF746_07105 [Chitinophagaceae bacterium]|nr:hypothetical protein [Chitinophagaceae bacterium]
MTAFVFIIITLLSLLFLYWGTGKDKRLVFIFTIWQLLTGSFAFAEIFKKKPNLFPVAILGTVLLVLVNLKIIDRKKLNVKFLLAIHVLRIPVELILYQLYLQNKIPRLMTFTGWNFDILIGISALILLIYFVLAKGRLNRQFFISWNIAGILFLLFIVSSAILSSPLPIQQFAFEQPNRAVLEFPYCFLPACVVPVVLLSHILLISNQKKHCPAL